MKSSRWIVSALVMLLVVIGINPVSALDSPDTVETGRLLAILLDAGRVMVGANQALINDPAKVDKGFTPEVFEKQLAGKFKERTGVDLGNLKDANVPEMAKKLLPQLVETSVVSQ